MKLYILTSTREQKRSKQKLSIDVRKAADIYQYRMKIVRTHESIQWIIKKEVENKKENNDCN